MEFHIKSTFSSFLLLLKLSNKLTINGQQSCTPMLQYLGIGVILLYVLNKMTNITCLHGSARCVETGIRKEQSSVMMLIQICMTGVLIVRLKSFQTARLEDKEHLGAPINVETENEIQLLVKFVMTVI